MPIKKALPSSVSVKWLLLLSQLPPHIRPVTEPKHLRWFAFCPKTNQTLRCMSMWVPGICRRVLSSTPAWTALYVRHRGHFKTSLHLTVLQAKTEQDRNQPENAHRKPSHHINRWQAIKYCLLKRNQYAQKKNTIICLGSTQSSAIKTLLRHQFS